MLKTRAILLSASLLPFAAFAQVPVEVSLLRDVLQDMEHSAPAQVVTLNQTTLAAQVGAVISDVFADTGQAVRKGDLLIGLDESDYRLALNQAEAHLESSKAQKAQADARLKRARELGANQYLSADDLLARETEAMVLGAQIEVQEVNVAIARHNLAKCRILAPFDGVVLERSAQLGNYVTTGSPLLSLSETDRFELEAEVPDEVADSLLQAHDLRFESRGESWPVALLRLSPVIDTERRSRKARLGFEARSPAIGRSGELLWNSEQGLLPASLLVRRGEGLGIFLNRAGTAEFVPLPDAQEGRPFAIDLPPDSEVVVQGREKLQHGDALAVSRPGETR